MVSVRRVQQRIALEPVAILDFFYLESKSQPSLGEFQEANLALRLGYLVRCRYAFVRSTSVLIPSWHFTQTFKSAGHLGSACVGLSSGREHRSAMSASFKMVRRAAGVFKILAVAR